ncbi:hypothetical protein HDU91_002521, partial [Kappamyces sp. JEL0680]
MGQGRVQPETTPAEVKLDMEGDKPRKGSIFRSFTRSKFRKSIKMAELRESEDEDQEFEMLVKNSQRVEKFLEWKRKTISLLQDFENLDFGNTDDIERSRKTFIGVQGGIAKEGNEWIMTRFMRLVKELKNSRMTKKFPLLDALDNFHWVLLDAAGGHAADEEVDQELWERFAVKIEGLNVAAIEDGDVEQTEVREIKLKAAALFTAEFKSSLKA